MMLVLHRSFLAKKWFLGFPNTNNHVFLRELDKLKLCKHFLFDSCNIVLHKCYKKYLQFYILACSWHPIVWFFSVNALKLCCLYFIYHELLFDFIFLMKSSNFLLNLFKLHAFGCVSSNFLLKKIICHKIHICNLCDLHEL